MHVPSTFRRVVNQTVKKNALLVFHIISSLYPLAWKFGQAVHSPWRGDLRRTSTQSSKRKHKLQLPGSPDVLQQELDARGHSRSIDPNMMTVNASAMLSSRIVVPGMRNRYVERQVT